MNYLDKVVAQLDNQNMETENGIVFKLVNVRPGFFVYQPDNIESERKFQTYAKYIASLIKHGTGSNFQAVTHGDTSSINPAYPNTGYLRVSKIPGIIEGVISVLEENGLSWDYNPCFGAILVDREDPETSVVIERLNEYPEMIEKIISGTKEFDSDYILSISDIYNGSGGPRYFSEGCK